MEGGPYMVLSKGGFGDGPHHSCMAFFGRMEERNVEFLKKNASGVQRMWNLCIEFSCLLSKKIH
jgi:hypothetical protein